MLHTVNHLSDLLLKFLNISNYKHLIVLIVYILTTYIMVEVFYIKDLVHKNTYYISNLKKQSILQFLNNYNEYAYTFNYIDLYFVSQYCLELLETDVLIKQPCNEILTIFYKYNNK